MNFVTDILHVEPMELLRGGGGGGGGPFFFVGMLKTFLCFIVFLYMSAGCVSTIRT